MAEGVCYLLLQLIGHRIHLGWWLYVSTPHVMYHIRLDVAGVMMFLLGASLIMAGAIEEYS